MAYVKPGVEVRQEQVTVSPNLIAPDLGSVLIGPGYFVAEPEDYSYSETYDNGSGVSFSYASLPSGAEVDTNSVYVDLIVASGVNSGTVYHLTSSDFSASSSQITLNASLASTYTDVYGAAIKAGYRALRTDLDSFLAIQSLGEIEEFIGKPVSYNPLGISLEKCLVSAASTVYAMPSAHANGVEDTTTKNAAIDTLATKEIYAIVPLADDKDVIAEFKTHAVSYSEPENKKERIVLGAVSIPWTSTVGTDLANTAAEVKSWAYQQQETRLIRVFPDVCYVKEVRHISTLYATFMNNVQGSYSGLQAILANEYSVTLSGVLTRYKVGTVLTDTILNNLTLEHTYLFVEVPVAGYVAASAVAGQISGFDPEAPLTNVPISGISRIKYSSDTFSEANLNTMAEGGNYLLVQNSNTLPVYSRHQMTTNTTTIEKREVSIRKSLDFVAKFMRNNLASYIGRYNITPNFLKLMTMTMQAQAIFLVREGVVNDMKILELKQDTVFPDTLLATVSVLPKYPVNYIKITLQF